MKSIFPIRLIAAPFSLAIAVFALLLSPIARADHHDHDDHVEARALLQRGEILPLSRILSIVQQRFPGDVIEVELDHGKHGWEYEVKVLASTGVVSKVYVNAHDGSIRKVKDD